MYQAEIVLSICDFQVGKNKIWCFFLWLKLRPQIGLEGLSVIYFFYYRLQNAYGMSKTEIVNNLSLMIVLRQK